MVKGPDCLCPNLDSALYQVCDIQQMIYLLYASIFSTVKWGYNNGNIPLRILVISNDFELLRIVPG